MRRLIVLLASILLWATAGAQDVPSDLELVEEVEPELRRYTVEIIVFAYAEDVSVGTELFLPDIIEPEPELLEILEDDGDIRHFRRRLQSHGPAAVGASVSEVRLVIVGGLRRRVRRGAAHHVDDVG